MKPADLMLSALLIPALCIAQAPAGAGAPVVYFSVFGPDGSALQSFYRAVFDWEIAGNGDVAASVTAWVSWRWKTVRPRCPNRW